MWLRGQTNFTRWWYDHRDLGAAEARWAIVHVLSEAMLGLALLLFVGGLVRARVWRRTPYLVFILAIASSDLLRVAYYLLFNSLALARLGVDDMGMGARVSYALATHFLSYGPYLFRIFLMSCLAAYRFLAVAAPIQFHVHDGVKKVAGVTAFCGVIGFGLAAYLGADLKRCYTTDPRSHFPYACGLSDPEGEWEAQQLFITQFWATIIGLNLLIYILLHLATTVALLFKRRHKPSSVSSSTHGFVKRHILNFKMERNLLFLGFGLGGLFMLNMFVNVHSTGLNYFYRQILIDLGYGLEPVVCWLLSADLRKAIKDIYFPIHST